MTDPLKLADELDHIAYAISETLYAHNMEIRKSYNGDKMIRYDHMDRLHEIAREVRGEDGQLAHRLNRTTVPW